MKKPKKSQALAEKAKAEKLAADAKAEAERLEKEMAAKLAAAAKKGAVEKQLAEKQLKKAEADAKKALEQARKQLGADKNEVLRMAKEKFDKAKAEQEAKLQQAQALQAELERLADLPIGFMKKTGELKVIAAGLERTGEGKDAKRELASWGITKDDKLVKMTPNINPWMVHIAKAADGSLLEKPESVDVGSDGTTYAIFGGKLYRYSLAGGGKSLAPGKAKKAKRKNKAGKKKKAKKSKEAKEIDKGYFKELFSKVEAIVEGAREKTGKRAQKANAKLIRKLFNSRDAKNKRELAKLDPLLMRVRKTSIVSDGFKEKISNMVKRIRSEINKEEDE